jgi:hypothetical protein
VGVAALVVAAVLVALLGAAVAGEAIRPGSPGHGAPPSHHLAGATTAASSSEPPGRRISDASGTARPLPVAAATPTPEPTPTSAPEPSVAPPVAPAVAPTPVPTSLPVPNPEPPVEIAAPPADGAPPPVPPAPPVADAAVLVGAGDIASCFSGGDEATAALLDGIAGTVFTAGDNAYESGTPEEFAACYEPSWGRHRARTLPAAGNHEYVTPGAAGHFAYFGAAAGPAGLGYHAYDIGAWRAYVINSNCWAIGGCGSGSAQEAWLRADLAANPRSCILAYWHHPRFSSGQHGGDASVDAIWQALYNHGAELVVNGHDHDYERFAPQSPGGLFDPATGIRQIVVGTGGASLRPFAGLAANSEARSADAFGVIVLGLSPGSYSWQFVPAAGAGFTDSGSGTCH